MKNVLIAILVLLIVTTACGEPVSGTVTNKTAEEVVVWVIPGKVSTQKTVYYVHVSTPSGNKSLKVDEQTWNSVQIGNQYP